MMINNVKLSELKDDLIEYKCLYCGKNYQRKFEEKLKELFFNAYKFSNNDIYPNEYIDDWGKFNET